MHKKINIIIYVIIVLLLIYLLILNIINNSKIKEYERYYNYLGTDIDIKIYSKKIDDKVFDEIEKIYKEYDNLISNNLYNLNNSNDDIIEVDSKLYELIKLGLDYYNKSNGYININMGCIYNSYDDNIYTVDDILCDSNIKNIELLGNNKIKNNNFNINLDNIKISYVNNIISNLIKQKGYKDYIISTSGNIIVGEKNYDSKPFNVGVQSNKNDILDIIKLSNKSMVSKGTYNGLKSIISPITKIPENNYLNVSVISNDNMLSNYLVNILYFKTIEEGKEIIKNYDADVIWIDKDKKMYYTDGYLNYK